MKSFLIGVAVCAVPFYSRFLWAIQKELRQRSKNRTDSRQPSPYVSLLKINIAAVLAQTSSNAPPGAQKF